MRFEEVKKDLFTMSEEYKLAHCISSDAKMGAGIAVMFRKKFKLTSLTKLADYRMLEIGSCHLIDRALNLITKEKYWDKPTYSSFTKSVESMKQLCLQEGIKKIAMPKIGCGLDGLQWERVREIIKETFADTDIEIVVCYI